MVLCGIWAVRWREVQNLRAFGAKANKAQTRADGSGGDGEIEMQEREGMMGQGADESV
jgi:hypothetical protein